MNILFAQIVWQSINKVFGQKLFKLKKVKKTVLSKNRHKIIKNPNFSQFQYNLLY